MTREELLNAMEQRNGVRSYIDKPIPAEIVAELQADVDRLNQEHSLHIQLMTEDPAAFQSVLSRVGNFWGVRNYFAFIGEDRKGIEEALGYAGEWLVLKAQHLGLNTCWVGLTFSKSQSAAEVLPGERFICVAALGYGETQGTRHISKPAEKLYKLLDNPPEWFMDGIRAAMLAPTAHNQQNFVFSLMGRFVTLQTPPDHYSLISKGIVKRHFEIGAGDGGKWRWV